MAFIPLSPKSSQTMNRHLRSQIEVTESEVGSEGEERAPEEEQGRIAAGRPQLHRRRSSDPTANRPVVRRQRHGRSASRSDSEGDVEELPDRFDSHGIPLDGRPASGQPPWTSRSGEFQRRPRRHSDWGVKGAWHVSGTDGIQVDRLARSVTEALDGRKSWLGVIGEALGGGGLLAQPEEKRGLRDEEEGGRRRRRGS